MKCPYCETELIYIEEDNCNYCPNCNSKFEILSDDEIEEELAHSKYDSMSAGPTVGALLSLVIYIICVIIQFTSSSPIGVLVASIFSAIASIAFSIFFAISIIYKCIDKYHMQTVAPMQDEIAELKKEIENLKKEIK